MPTNTTNYNFKKPIVGADEDLWGGYINDNLDDLDSLLAGDTQLSDIDVSGTVTTANLTVGATTFPNAGALSSRNLIINGAMQVWQRGSAATAAVNSSYSTVDRFEFYLSGGGAYTTEKSTGHLADTGHDTALKISVTTADTSIASGDFYSFLQKIEAQNLQRLQYGTSSAKEMTLSFWVRATKTGTQTVFLTKEDATAHKFTQEYTINESDTWEYKTIKIPALTASGIANDSGTGMQVGWILKYGSTYNGTAGSWSTDSIYTTANAVNNMDSTSNTFYITGVQLEVGDTATPFEHRSYGDELQRCQRYYERVETSHRSSGSGYYTNYGNTKWVGPQFDYKVTKRAVPTLSDLGTLSWRRATFRNGSTTTIGTGATGFSGTTVDSCTVEIAESGPSNGNIALVFSNAGYTIEADAEL